MTKKMFFAQGLKCEASMLDSVSLEKSSTHEFMGCHRISPPRLFVTFAVKGASKPKDAESAMIMLASQEKDRTAPLNMNVYGDNIPAVLLELRNVGFYTKDEAEAMMERFDTQMLKIRQYAAFILKGGFVPEDVNADIHQFTNSEIKFSKDEKHVRSYREYQEFKNQSKDDQSIANVVNQFISQSMTPQQNN